MGALFENRLDLLLFSSAVNSPDVAVDELQLLSSPFKPFLGDTLTVSWNYAYPSTAVHVSGGGHLRSGARDTILKLMALTISSRLLKVVAEGDPAL